MSFSICGGRIVVPRKVSRLIDAIFEHEDNVYSVYLVNPESPVEWLQGKTELYAFLHSLQEK